MLSTKNLSHSYKGTQAFNFPDLLCQPSETLLVIGQSGVGKSTLLHILAGILIPTKGEVLINDTSLYKQKTNALDTFRGQNIGMIFQKPHFVQAVSAVENLFLAQTMANKAKDTKRVHTLLDQLNISNRATAKTYQMSQGEQQRLSIARALVNNPKLILADEPTSALDDSNCNEVIQLLKHQAEAVNAALVIVTHDSRLKDIFPNQLELN